MFDLLVSTSDTVSPKGGRPLNALILSNMEVPTILVVVPPEVLVGSTVTSPAELSPAELPTPSSLPIPKSKSVPVTPADTPPLPVLFATPISSNSSPDKPVFTPILLVGTLVESVKLIPSLAAIAAPIPESIETGATSTSTGAEVVAVAL